MKRRILMLLSLALLAGCQSVPGAATEDTTEPMPHKPPALTVRVGENEGAAALSTYSWDWPNPDGTHSGVEADGLHPLDMLDYVTPLPLGDEGTVELRFEPGALGLDHLTLRRWDLGCAGDPSKYESDFDMLPCTVRGDTVTAELPDGRGGVFEVHAYFTGESHGDGYYTFCLQGKITPLTERIPFEPIDAQAVRIIWRETLAELPQAQILHSHEELMAAIGAEAGYESAGDLLDEQASIWTDDRFAAYDLILLRIESGSGSVSYHVDGVRQTPEGVTVSVRARAPEICTADMAAWLIFLRLPAGTAGEGPVTVSITTENIK